MTKNIFTKFAVATAGAALLAVVQNNPAHAAQLFDFDLIDDTFDTVGVGSLRVNSDAERVFVSETIEKFAVADFEVTLVNDVFTHSFTNPNSARAVFEEGEFLGVEHIGPSVGGDFVLLIDAGDGTVKDVPGSWSLWGPNPVDVISPLVKITGGSTVTYDAVPVPEPGSVAAVSILGLGMLLTKKKVASKQHVQLKNRN